MPVPLIIAILGAGAGLAWILLGGSAAYAIIANAKVIAYVIGGIVAIYILRFLFKK